MDDRGLGEIFVEIEFQILSGDQDMTDIEADREARFFYDVLDPFEGTSERLDRDAIQLDPILSHFFNTSKQTHPPGFNVSFLSSIAIPQVEMEDINGRV